MCLYFHVNNVDRSIYLAFMVRRLLTVAENLTTVDDKVIYAR